MNDFLIDKRRMRRAFSRAAPDYDAAAVLQREVCERMLERLAYIKLQPTRILDAGSGTGWGTRQLAEKYLAGHCPWHAAGCAQPFRLVAEAVRRRSADASVRRYRSPAIGHQQCRDGMVEPRGAVVQRPAGGFCRAASRAEGGRAADVQHFRAGYAEGVAPGFQRRGQSQSPEPLCRHARHRRHAGACRFRRAGDGHGIPDADLRRRARRVARPEAHRRTQCHGRTRPRPDGEECLGAPGGKLRAAAPRRQAARHLRGGIRPRLEAAAAHDRRWRSDRSDHLQAEMNYFITGTDTGVGKTLVSCALLHGFAAQGRRVVGMKPVAAGCADGGQHEDVRQLRAASNVLASGGQINPYCFMQAVAPLLAAQFVGISINFARILESFSELNAQADVVIVEGVGGFRVPLNDSQDSADLAEQLGLPVILVVGMRLGCQNHALLTAEAIAARGLTLAGWVANVPDADGTTRRCEASGAGVPSDRLLPQTAGYAITSDLASVVGSPSRMASSSTSNVSKADMAMLDKNIAALQQRLNAPLLGVVPYQARPDARAAASLLDMALLEQPGTHG